MDDWLEVIFENPLNKQLIINVILSINIIDLKSFATIFKELNFN